MKRQTYVRMLGPRVLHGMHQQHIIGDQGIGARRRDIACNQLTSSIRSHHRVLVMESHSEKNLPMNTLCRTNDAA